MEEISNNFLKYQQLKQNINESKEITDSLVSAIMETYPIMGSDSLKFLFELQNIENNKLIEYLEQLSQTGNIFLNAIYRIIIDQKNQISNFQKQNELIQSDNNKIENSYSYSELSNHNDLIQQCFAQSSTYESDEFKLDIETIILNSIKEDNQEKLYEVKDAEFKKTDKDGNTPLHIAAIYDKPHAAQRFVSIIDVNKQNIKGQTALHIAAINGSIKMFTTLLENGADQSIADNNGQLPIHYAAMNGNPKFLELMLDFDLDKKLFEKRDNSKMTPFMVACQHRSLELIDYILKSQLIANLENESLPNGTNSLHLLLNPIRPSDTPTNGFHSDELINIIREIDSFDQKTFSSWINEENIESKSPNDMAEKEIKKYFARRNKSTQRHYTIQNESIKEQRPETSTEASSETKNSENTNCGIVYEKSDAKRRPFKFNNKIPEIINLIDTKEKFDKVINDTRTGKKELFKAISMKYNALHHELKENEGDQNKKEEAQMYWDFAEYVCNNPIEDFDINSEYPVHTILSNYDLDFEFFKMVCESKLIDLNNVEPKRNETPIFTAIITKKKWEFKYLLNNKQVNLNHRNKFGMNVLMACCRSFQTIPYYFKKVMKKNREEGLYDINQPDDRGWTALHFAAQNNNKEMVECLLEEININIDPIDNEGCTPFMSAVKNLAIGTFSLLINKTEFLNKADINGIDSLMEATRLNSSMFSTLVERKEFDVKRKDNKGRTGVMLAIDQKNPQIIEKILVMKQIDKYQEVFQMTDNEGRNIIHHIAMLDDAEGVKALRIIYNNLEDINYNLTDKYDDTPLILATKLVKNEIVRELCKIPRCNVDRKNEKGETAYSLGTSEIKTIISESKRVRIKTYRSYSDGFYDDDYDISEAYTNDEYNTSNNNLDAYKQNDDLSKKQDDYESESSPQTEIQTKRVVCFPPEKTKRKPAFDKLLFDFISRGNSTNFMEILQTGEYYGINDYNNEQKTYLHLAAVNARDDIVKYLLDCNEIKPNEMDSRGKWPLYCAIENLKFQTAEMMMSYPSVDLNLKDKSGGTILHLAAIKHAISLIPIIIDRIDDPNSKDRYGKTALHLAAQKGALDSIEVLINSQKVNIGEKDNTKRTALHIAAGTNRADIVKLLCTHKEFLNDQDECGKTPMYLAAENDCIECVKILLDAGTDPNICDKDGRTVLMYALTKNRPVLIDMLLENQRVDVNMAGKLGRTALHLVAMSGRDESLKKLLEYHARTGKLNLNARDSDGRTPFFLAIIHKCNDNAIMLAKTRGTNTQLKDKGNHTPFEYCRDFGVLRAAGRL